MAAATRGLQVLEGENKNNGISKQEVEAAVAKAVELRALHAAVVHGNGNLSSNLRLRSFPVSLPPSQFSAQDYPIFNPSYEDEAAVHSQHQFPGRSRTSTATWEDYGQGVNGNELVYKIENSVSGIGFSSDFPNIESHFSPVDDHSSVADSRSNKNSVILTSPGTDFFKSSRSSYRPENAARKSTNSNIATPLTDSHSSIQSQPKSRGMLLSWLTQKLKKKHRPGTWRLNGTEPEVASQDFRDFRVVASIEELKRQLLEANEMRDAALREVSEMRSSLGELKQKLEYLESYCEELKKALKNATQNVPKTEKLVDNGKSFFSVSQESMVQGFSQMTLEARLAVKQFCKILIRQMEDADHTLADKLNLVLQPYKVSLNAKHSKVFFYHLEAAINQILHEDFENCVFQKTGAPKILDPQEERKARFQSFAALKDLSWNEVLKKGTKFYSEELSKFCDQKMSCIIKALNWNKAWPEQLLQAFFVAAKCIWLLHLLAFSFDPPLGILRVEHNRSFDPHYMENVLIEQQGSQGPSRVATMVIPGFYVHDKVLKCKVLCRC